MNSQEIEAIKKKAAEEKVVIAMAVGKLCRRIEQDFNGRLRNPTNQGLLRTLVAYTQDHITSSIGRLFMFPQGFVTYKADQIDVNIELIQDFIDHKALSRGIKLRRISDERI